MMFSKDPRNLRRPIYSLISAPLVTWLLFSALSLALSLLLVCLPRQNHLTSEFGPDSGKPSGGVSDSSPSLDSSRVGECVAGCGRLAVMGCPEGLDRHCVEVCNHVLSEKLTVTCWTRATTVEAVRACGVECKR